jgi:hypothetical protein
MSKVQQESFEGELHFHACKAYGKRNSGQQTLAEPEPVGQEKNAVQECGEKNKNSLSKLQMR